MLLRTRRDGGLPGQAGLDLVEVCVTVKEERCEIVHGNLGRQNCINLSYTSEEWSEQEGHKQPELTQSSQYSCYGYFAKTKVECPCSFCTSRSWFECCQGYPVAIGTLCIFNGLHLKELISRNCFVLSNKSSKRLKAPLPLDTTPICRHLGQVGCVCMPPLVT